MAREFFKDHRFSDEKEALLAKMIAILNDYARQGFRLTLRQLYYQLVARGLIPNNLQSYARIGDLLSDARLAGRVDWDMIEDRNRETIFAPHWESPSQILRAVADQYREDKWATQRYHIEVMVEKDALSGVLVPVCRALDIRLTANKGYSSQSALYEIGKRIEDKLNDDKEVMILYMGDHDPSGLDMTRDVRERLSMFANTSNFGMEDIDVRRLALNIEQVRTLNPPENPAKLTDSRAKGYIREFGLSSWELDAVEPRMLAQLIESIVLQYRDEDEWQAAVEQEEERKAHLAALADEWDEEHRTYDEEDEDD